MAKKTKENLEFLLVKAELKGIPEKGLLRSRNIGQVDLVWPRTGVAKKSGAREMVFKRGVGLSQKLDASAVLLHDPHDEVSNLWGAFGRVRRSVSRLRLHFACKGL